MSLASMTGFARAQGATGTHAWTWELKSVNGKGLDLRLRLPPGWDGVEPAVRAATSRALARGNVTATLTLTREGVAPTVRVNEEALAAVIAAIGRIAKRVDAAPASLDGILGLKGVVEIVEAEESDAERGAAEAAVQKGFETALADLVTARRSEGTALEQILRDRVTAIAKLVDQAEASPGRKPEAIRARLAEQVKALLDTDVKLDADRLHQEAALLAAKADVREEIDRLKTHVAAAREMLKNGGAVGRRLDFLAQEFNREANTLCAKANDGVLSAVGLELKAVVDQFREQVQNLE
ncbi:MAG TPA: YicC/YloC family endoribonuclease [Xanthobacteraceae bacterium]|nr:YicC/YloC family endoribonuclease [Xanthobacteraceae bacterium]